MKKTISTHTIAAISTPAGEGGIAVIRISGPDALKNSARFLSYQGKLKERAAMLARLKTGSVRDEAILLYFKAPRSFTGEDVLEIHCHGNYFLAEKVVEALVQNGCRAAEPGEFTRRAFLNGRIDLTQAEGIIDLIHAKSESAVAAAYAQVKGEIFQTVDAIQRRLITLIAQASVAVDYPEEDITAPAKHEILAGAEPLKRQLEELRASYDGGVLLREGVRVAIIGAPNVGKSLLLNRLLGINRAIVTPEAGTTRDTIEESFLYKGVRFTVTDTAGMREAESEAERLGIERSLRAAEQANLVLAVSDTADGGWRMVNGKEDKGKRIEGKGQKFAIPAGKSVIYVQNKIDLIQIIKYKVQITNADNNSKTPSVIPASTSPPPASHSLTPIPVSALTGENIGALKEAVYAATVGKISAHGASINNLRQLTAVVKTLEALNRLQASENLSLDCMLSDLNEAYRQLGAVTGVTAADAIVDEIFAKFCVGK